MVTFCIALRNGCAFMCLPLQQRRVCRSVGVGGLSFLAAALSLRALRLTIYRQYVLVGTEDKNRSFSLAIYLRLFCTSFS